FFTPRQWNFGTVREGCGSATTVFDVYNACEQPVQVEDFAMRDPAGEAAGGPDCPGPNACPEFLLAGAPSFTAGTVFQPGATTPNTFAITYHPINPGADMGTFVLSVLQNGAPLDYLVQLRGNGDTMGLNVDTFVQQPRPKADLLFVIDNSCSMADKQDAVEQKLDSFFGSIVDAGVDFHAGVIDTDYMCGMRTGGELHGDASNPTVLTASTPGVEALFANKVKVGMMGCNNAAGAEAATRALTVPLVTNANAGFLRTDAVLAIIVVSDAADASPQPPAYYESVLRSVKPVL